MKASASSPIDGLESFGVGGKSGERDVGVRLDKELGMVEYGM
jgi:hypothetical protein